MAKLREGRFSTPSEYIRSLIRDDQDVSGKADLAVLVRRGVITGNNGAETKAHPAGWKRKK